MFSASGDSQATLHSLSSLPAKTSRNGECQAPALPNEAERLSAIIATQQEIATAGLDLQAVMSLIAERTQALTGASGAAVVRAEGDELVYRAVSGTAAHSLGLRLKLDASLSGQCLRTGQALRCDDAEADERVDREACRTVGLRSMIAVPLLYDRRAVGVLKVLSPQPGAFGDRDVQTLQLMAGLIAAALSHAAAYEAKQALVEERTGALRQSEERLRLLWESAAVLLTTEEPDAMLRGLFTKLAPHFGLDAYFNYMVNDGAVSGALGGLVGNQGGIRSAAMLGFDVPKHAFVATATAVGVIVDAAQMPVYLVSQGEEVAGLWPFLVAGTAGAVVESVVGERLLRRIPEPVYRRSLRG